MSIQEENEVARSAPPGASVTASHTPAPWRALCLKDYTRVTRDSQGPNDPTGSVQICHIAGPEDGDLRPFNRKRWEADARLIAAAPTTLEALAGMVLVCGRTGNPLDDFEEQAAAFHRETGWMRPGKDMPAAGSDERTNHEMRWERYAAWVQGKIQAGRAAIAKATKP